MGPHILQRRDRLSRVRQEQLAEKMRVLAEDSKVQLSISYTTRPPRPGEADGREYHFVDLATFQAMADHGDFLESAEVHGNRYGTSQAWIAATSTWSGRAAPIPTRT